MEISALGVLICKGHGGSIGETQPHPEVEEGQTRTSIETDSDVEEVQQRAPCHNYIGWLQHVGAHLIWQGSRAAFI